MIPGYQFLENEKPCFKDKPKGRREPFTLLKEEESRVEVPAIINQYLRDYQRDGIKFMFDVIYKKNGCILADDMGLGKTVQVIGLMAAVLCKTGVKESQIPEFLKRKETMSERKITFLVVAPSSVLYNWEDEFNTWGYFTVGIFHKGAKEQALFRAKKGKLDVMLTTYETLRKHIREINSVTWYAVVLDEAHKIKETTAQVTIVAKELLVPSRIALTGTPLQNNMEELWCLLDWANPGCLGELAKFQKEFVGPIKQGQKFDANRRELAMGRHKQKEFANLKNKWFLRRTKHLIRDQLPLKDEKIVFCPMTKVQIAIYEEILQQPDVQQFFTINQPCSCGSKKIKVRCCFETTSDGKGMKSSILEYLQLLLKVSNHTALLLPSNKQSNNQEIKADGMVKNVTRKYPILNDLYKETNLVKMTHPSLSGKMTVLNTLLTALKSSKCKVLLFSHSIQILNIIEAYIISCGYAYRRIDGATRSDLRISIVKEFNQDPGIFACLVTTRTGGVGLNFIGANVVVIFDPSWNPSYDQQAQDRAYRIGQQRDVKIYRFISSGSVEENLYLRQIYKMQLANMALYASKERRYFTAVAGDKHAKGELFGIKNTFCLRTDGSSISKDIIDRTTKLENGVKCTDYQLTADYKDKAQAQCTESFRRVHSLFKSDDEKIFIKKKQHPKKRRECWKSYNRNKKIGDKRKNTHTDEEENTCSDYDLLESNEENKQKRFFTLPGSDNDSNSTEEKDIDKFIDDFGLEVTSGGSIIGTCVRERKLAAKATRDIFVHGLQSQQLANNLSYEAEDSDESDDIPLGDVSAKHSLVSRVDPHGMKGVKQDDKGYFISAEAARISDKRKTEDSKLTTNKHTMIGSKVLTKSDVAHTYASESTQLECTSLKEGHISIVKATEKTLSVEKVQEFSKKPEAMSGRTDSTRWAETKKETSCCRGHEISLQDGAFVKNKFTKVKPKVEIERNVLNTTTLYVPGKKNGRKRSGTNKSDETVFSATGNEDKDSLDDGPWVGLDELLFGEASSLQRTKSYEKETVKEGNSVLDDLLYPTSSMQKVKYKELLTTATTNCINDSKEPTCIKSILDELMD